MIPKQLVDIGEGDVRALMDGQVPERKTLDYKSELPSNSDADKKEFLADVSSFANTEGGDLIFGVEERDGKPAKISGLNLKDFDGAIQRLDSIILSGLKPRVRHHVARISRGDGNDVLILRVERSRIGPHRVVFQGSDKFWARTNGGKYSLDVEELRNAFLQSASVADRIRTFRLERLTDVISGRTSITVADNPRMVLHLVPLDSFASIHEYDVLSFWKDSAAVAPMHDHGWQHHINLDGVATSSRNENGVFSYTQVFRNGVIEAVSGLAASHVDDEGRTWVIGGGVEPDAIEYVTRYLGALRQLGISPPVYVFLSLTGVKGSLLDVGDRWRRSANRPQPLDRDVLSLPESTFEAFGDDVAMTLQPAFDRMWNAYGYPRSEFYKPIK